MISAMDGTVLPFLMAILWFVMRHVLKIERKTDAEEEYRICCQKSMFVLFFSYGSTVAFGQANDH